MNFDTSLFNLSLPWWEFILRAVVVYTFLLFALRMTGRRQIGQLSPFDLILLLIISNAVQNSMNGGDNSLLGGLISALALVLLNYSASWLTYRSKSASRIIEGQAELLIHNGVIFEKTLEEEKITRHDLNAAIRKAGCATVAEVHFAILETNGAITVRPKPRN